MARFKIKIDTEAIKRNGMRPKNQDWFDYEPAIIVGEFDEKDTLLNERLAHTVHILGPCQVVQNDGQPGFKGMDGRSARVWIETNSDVSLF